ncbi:MAG: ABC transporter ATP-binding protein [Candidatus Solibacter sp.]
MSDIAIVTRGLSKQYTIGANQKAYRTLREAVMDSVKAPLQALRGKRRSPKPAAVAEDTALWALDDVSFEIKKGEVIGIIGRNGAGKSTLLKVLARITEPTRGEADLYGRIGTLLEVGTGFHPELTGRENIYLNGAILGMDRHEISARFDEIVAFAEVERFVDTPVKFYSSGMYLRLAFAVAAHMETEILMVDEVLAVGDIAFQNKCMGKMGEAAKCGRTVLFISHNMGAIRSLCQKGLVLHQGRVAYAGGISASIETYFRLAATNDAESAQKGISANRWGFGPVRLTSHAGSTIEQSDPIEVATVLNIPEEVPGFSIYCIVHDMHQRKLFQKQQDSTEFSRSKNWRGSYEFRIQLPTLWLEPGLYALYFKVFIRTSSQSARHVSDVFHLDVGGQSAGCGSILSPSGDWRVQELDVEPSLDLLAAGSSEQ